MPDPQTRPQTRGPEREKEREGGPQREMATATATAGVAEAGDAQVGASPAELRRGLRAITAGALRAAQARARAMDAAASVTMRDLRVILTMVQSLGAGRPFQAYLAQPDAPPPTLESLRAAGDVEAFYDRAMHWLHAASRARAAIEELGGALPALMDVVDAILREAEPYCVKEDELNEQDWD